MAAVASPDLLTAQIKLLNVSGKGVLQGGVAIIQFPLSPTHRDLKLKATPECRPGHFTLFPMPMAALFLATTFQGCKKLPCISHFPSSNSKAGASQVCKLLCTCLDLNTGLFCLCVSAR